MARRKERAANAALADALIATAEKNPEQIADLEKAVRLEYGEISPEMEQLLWHLREIARLNQC